MFVHGTKCRACLPAKYVLMDSLSRSFELLQQQSMLVSVNFQSKIFLLSCWGEMKTNIKTSLPSWELDDMMSFEWGSLLKILLDLVAG